MSRRSLHVAWVAGFGLCVHIATASVGASVTFFAGKTVAARSPNGSVSKEILDLETSRGRGRSALCVRWGGRAANVRAP